MTAALLAACSTSPQASVSPFPSAVHPTPTSSDCPLGNTISVSTELGDTDSGRSITIHLCAVISVRLGDSTGIRSSDAAVLAILPLPLPAPPPGGAYTWFQAKRTGTADLSSEGRSTAKHWTVHVTVLV